MPPTDDLKRISQDWTQYSFYVLTTLQDFKTAHEDLNEKLDELSKEIPLLKFKTGLIIAGVSAGVSIIFSAAVGALFFYLFKVK